MIEGEIAGLSVVLKLRGNIKDAEERREYLIKFLWDEYRTSPLLSRARKGKELVTISEDEMLKLRKENPPLISFG